MERQGKYCVGFFEFDFSFDSKEKRRDGEKRIKPRPELGQKAFLNKERRNFPPSGAYQLCNSSQLLVNSAILANLS